MTKTPNALKIEPIEGNRLQMIQGNTLIAVSPPSVIKGVLMGVLGVFDDKFDNLTIDELKEAVSQIGENRVLLECLIKYESNWNINAKGKAGEVGCLQFLPSTWDYFIKPEKYNLELDINNFGHQIILANLMLNDNLGFHWTTYRNCIK